MSYTGQALRLIIFLVLGICIYAQCISGNEGDKGWILNFSAMWLSGKALYSGIFSALPPLIFWLYAIPVSLGNFLHLSSGFVLALMGLVTTGFTVALSVRLIKYVPMFAEQKRLRVEFALLLSFMLIVWTNSHYFFDREHIFLVLTFPYILRFMPSLAGQPLPSRLRVLIGVMAAIGFCIKPHCALVFAGVQLLILYRTRSWRMLFCLENSIIYLVGLAYLAATAALAPEYFTLVLPMSLATYSAAADPMAMLVYGVIAILIFSLTCVDFRLRDQSPYRSDILYFACACAVLLLYALVNNGWGYTWNPLYEFILLLTGFVRWEHQYLATQPEKTAGDLRRFQFGSRACMLNFTLNTFAILALYAADNFASHSVAGKIDADIQAIAHSAGARSFGAISIDLEHPANLANDSGIRMETRFNHLWMLPKFFIADSNFKETNRWILTYVARAYADDLNFHKPDLMLIDDTDMFYRIYHPVGLIAYLSAVDDSFRTAWSHYHLLASVNYCARQGVEKPRKQGCKFDVYKRIKP